MIAICISSKEANPGCSAAEPSHRPEKLFGHMAETVPASALTAWIVLFERNEGVKGKPARREALIAWMSPFFERNDRCRRGTAVCESSRAICPWPKVRLSPVPLNNEMTFKNRLVMSSAIRTVQWSYHG